MSRSLWFAFSLGLLSMSVACGGDDASSSPSPKLSKAGSGGSGEGGSESGGSSSGGSDSGGSDSGGTSSGGTDSGGTSSGGQGGSDGPACVTNPPELLDCGSATDCQACLCDKCADAWADCMADDGCKKAVSCVAAGCSLSQCASLTSGEASLAKAEAIEDCRASKQKCRTECTGGGVGGSSGGSGGSDAGGSGGSETAGSAGSGNTGGSGVTVTEPTCCTISEKPGCNGASSGLSEEENAVQACVCAQDDFCCANAWDETCIGEISEFGCAPACPTGGQGGSGGSSSGSGGSSGGGSGSSGSGGGGQQCVPECGFGQICDPNTGNCEECLTNAQCKDNVYGPTCLGTSGETSLSCGCSSNFDCKAHPGGAYCEPFTNICGCKSAQDCADSPLGKVCVELNDPSKGKISQCGCDTEADCAPGDKCLFGQCAQQ